ncbi:MAG: PaaI family thioesterase [Myxococcales bacterium]
MQPRDPAFEQKVRESFEKQKVMAFLGARLTRLEPGLCEIELPFRDELTQQHGYFHAGVMTTVMDSAGGYAGFSLFPPDSSVMAVEFKVNFMNPGDGDLFVATGRVLKSGRTLTVCSLEGAVRKAGKLTPCAAGMQTLMCLQGTPERA